MKKYILTFIAVLLAGVSTAWGQVAQIGTDTYPTLQDAFDAATSDGVTVTLLSNVSLDESTATIASGKKVTLELGDYTITASGVVFENNGTLIINSGSNGGMNSTGDAIIKCCSNSVTIFNNGTFSGTDGCIYTGKTQNSTITINDGTYVSTQNAIIMTNGTAGFGNHQITINGGTFNGSMDAGGVSQGYIACGIYAANNDTWTINGGTFNITGGAGIVQRAGTVNVTGGIFNCTGTATGKVGDKATSLTSSALVYDNTTPTYPGEQSNAILNVTGGTFSSEADIVNGMDETGDHITISGGTYNKAVDQIYCADGYFSKGSGASFTIDGPFQAKVDDTGYDTFAAAATAAGSTKTIELLTNILVPYTMEVGQELKVKKNGYIVTINPPTGYEVWESTTETGTNPTYTYKLGKSIGLSEITIDPATYKGAEFTLAQIKDLITVKDGENTLTEGTHYTVSISGGPFVEAKTYVDAITISGAGDYAGSVTKDFIILPVELPDIADATATAEIEGPLATALTDPALTDLTGLVLTVKDGETTLTQGQQFTATLASGTYGALGVYNNAVTLTGINTYKGTKVIPLTIWKSITSTDITVDAIADQTWTGSAITPAVTVKDGTTDLALTTNYTVEYSNNTEVGTATVTITGVDPYRGSREVTFNIKSQKGYKIVFNDDNNNTYVATEDLATGTYLAKTYTKEDIKAIMGSPGPFGIAPDEITDITIENTEGWTINPTTKDLTISKPSKDPVDMKVSYTKSSQSGEAVFYIHTYHLACTYGTEYEYDAVGHWKDCTNTDGEHEEVAVITDAEGYAEHSFDANNTCTVCDYQKSVPETHTHNFTVLWAYTTVTTDPYYGKHWHPCTGYHAYEAGIKTTDTADGDADAATACYTNTAAALADHTYGTDKHDVSYYTCTVCGFENPTRKATFTAHVFATTWQYSDTYHWHDCTATDAQNTTSGTLEDGDCQNNEASEYGEHTYGTDISETSYYTCVCGYENNDRKPHTCAYATAWTYDADNHWHACTVTTGYCTQPKKDVAAHTYGTSGPALYTCTVCGRVDEVRKAAAEANTDAPAYSWDYVIPYEFKATNVLNDRKMKEGQYYTVCLPYALQMNNLKAYYLEQTSNTLVGFKEQTIAELPATTPCLVMPAATGQPLSATDVTIVATKDLSRGAIAGYHPATGFNDNYSLFGSLKYIEKGDAANMYVMQGGTSDSPAGTFKMIPGSDADAYPKACVLPMRAYLKASGSPSREILGVRIIDADNNATAVDRLTIDEGDELQFYDLQGRRVMTPKKGSIYIVKGRKMIYK